MENYSSMSFEPRSDADIVRLIAEYPLAWVVSNGPDGLRATPLPLLAETGDDGQVTALFGHFALANPQVQMLRESPEATVLFNGPHGYISPEAVSQPQWAPTWNYAIAQFNTEIELVPEENDRALELLVTKMEADRRQPWTIDRMGDRYARMVPHIMAFRAHVKTARGRFKLGQDERPQTLKEVLGNLKDPALIRWMEDFNAPSPDSIDSA